MREEPKYKIGQKFKTRGKHPKICTVVDIFRTYNSKDELIKIIYQAEHDFIGQKVTDYEVPESTITIGIIK